MGCHFLQGIFLTQGSNLHWQADSLPLSHRGSPEVSLVVGKVIELNFKVSQGICDDSDSIFEIQNGEDKKKGGRERRKNGLGFGKKGGWVLVFDGYRVSVWNDGKFWR